MAPGVVVGLRSQALAGGQARTTLWSSPPLMPIRLKPLAVSIRSIASSGVSPKTLWSCWKRHTRCLSRATLVISTLKSSSVPTTLAAVPCGRFTSNSITPSGSTSQEYLPDAVTSAAVGRGWLDELYPSSRPALWWSAQSKPQSNHVHRCPKDLAMCLAVRSWTAVSN